MFVAYAVELIHSYPPEFYISICCACVAVLVFTQHIFPLKARTLLFFIASSTFPECSSNVLSTVSKTAAAGCFLLVAITRGALEREDMFSYGIKMGLLFGAIGDVCLLSQGAGVMFLLGLVSFLIGHIGYIMAFLSIPYNSTWMALGGVVYLVRSIIIWIVLNNKSNKSSSRKGKMKSPSVLAYIVVITIMVTAALGNVGDAFHTFGSFQEIYYHNPDVIYRFLGAEMFFFSDICVARERFVVSSPANKFIGLPLYFGAQLLTAYWM